MMKNIFFHENHYFAVRKFMSRQFKILINLDDWWVDKNSKFGPCIGRLLTSNKDMKVRKLVKILFELFKITFFMKKLCH